MSSPNEPGYPRATEGTGNGSGSGPDSGSGSRGPERIADATDVPPWQRGRSANPAAPARPDAPRRGNGGATGQTSGIDERLNRFLSGGSASSPQQESDASGWADPPEPPARPEPSPRPEPAVRPEPSSLPEPPSRPEPSRPEPSGRPEQPVRPEQYASEIPDLSGGAPRPGPRKPGPERPERPGQEQANRPARAAAAAGRAPVASRHQGPVRASMQIRRVDPWSVLKVSAVLSVALFFVWMIAVAFLYLVLGGMGVWSKLNSNVGDLLTSASGSSGGELVSSGTIFGGAALIGLVNIVLLTAMATIGAFIYNLTTDIVGGVEVTLADRD